MTSLLNEAIYWLLRSPQTYHAKPKTQINRRRTLPTSFPLVGYLPQAAWPERLLSEEWDAVALQQIKERGAHYLWLIMVISVRQSTDAAISGLHCRALVMVSSSIRLTAWLQNSKKRNGQRDWCEQSHRDYLALVICIIVLSWLLIITVITPLPTKPSAAKMPGGAQELANCGNYWHADASAWCCCARCKIHEGVSWC